jgi:hypothetical protein
VAGINLPIRSHRVRPYKIVIFSYFYEDGRKNEAWIFEYLTRDSNLSRKNIVLCLIGHGWEPFSEKLSAFDINYEVIRYSRRLPNEYDLQKEFLEKSDCLIYMGFDGGAMSVYDAIISGIDVLAPNISYHQGLGDVVQLFDNKEQFFVLLDSLIDRHMSRLRAVEGRDIGAYVTQLLTHWEQLLPEPATTAIYQPEITGHEVVSLFRSHYKSITVMRFIMAIRRYLVRVLK